MFQRLEQNNWTRVDIKTHLYHESALSELQCEIEKRRLPTVLTTKKYSFFHVIIIMEESWNITIMITLNKQKKQLKHHTNMMFRNVSFWSICKDFLLATSLDGKV